MRRVLISIAICGFMAGCGKPATTKTKAVIPTDQAPKVVMDAAAKREPDVKFNKVIKTPEGIYEVQGKNKSGKVIEVEVNEAGEVVKVE